jgi:hypothetical protein
VDPLHRLGRGKNPLKLVHRFGRIELVGAPERLDVESSINAAERRGQAPRNADDHYARALHLIGVAVQRWLQDDVVGSNLQAPRVARPLVCPRRLQG